MKSWILTITLGAVFSFWSGLVHGQDLPFKTARKIDSKFPEITNGLYLTLDTVAYLHSKNESSVIQFYYEQPDESSGPDVELKAVLRVDDYFYSMKVGYDPIIEIKNFMGSQNEMNINTGCFSDGGCNDKNLFLRFFKNAPFTITTLPTSMGGFNAIGDWGRNINKTTEADIRKKGGMIYIFSGGYKGKCHLDIRAIYPSGKGLKKGEQIAKIKVECVG